MLQAVRKAGLQMADIDVFEINEAFASQCKTNHLTWSFPHHYISLPSNASHHLPSQQHLQTLHTRTQFLIHLLTTSPIISLFFFQAGTFCVKQLAIPPEKINPLGGAIALGHPLGCSGVRLMVTLIHHLQRTGERYGCVSLCIGTGMGAAMIIENLSYRNVSSHPRARL